jgi:hypothetical protein
MPFCASWWKHAQMGSPASRSVNGGWGIEA